MKWTKTPPTKPGVYWARFYHLGPEPELIDVRNEDGELVGYQFGEENWLHIEIPDEWWPEAVTAPPARDH